MYQRVLQYKSPSAKRNSKIFLRIKEIGLVNFDLEILAEGSELDIRKLESETIVKLNTIWPNGYNMTSLSNGGGCVGSLVPRHYKERKVTVNNVEYANVYAASKATGLTVASIRMRANRNSGGCQW